MSLISKSLTWSTSTTTITTGTADERSAAMLFFIKQQLDAHGFSVVLSSDSSSSGASDYWVTSANVVWNTAGNARSWVVLEHSTAGYQICIDCISSAASNTALIELIISYSGAFAGGSTTARPTATDEWVHPTTSWTAEGSGERRGVFSYDSTNQFYYFVQATSTNTSRGWLFLGELSDVNSDWDEPLLVGFYGATFAVSELSLDAFYCNRDGGIREVVVGTAYGPSAIVKASGGVLDYYSNLTAVKAYVFDKGSAFYYGILPDLYLDTGYANDNDYIDDDTDTEAWFLWGIGWIPRQNGSGFLLDTSATPTNYDAEEIYGVAGLAKITIKGIADARQGEIFNISIAGNGGIVTS